MFSFTFQPHYSRERTTSNQCIGGWLERTVGLDAGRYEVKENIFTLPGIELLAFQRVRLFHTG
jgi:hypothetical protein